MHCVRKIVDNLYWVGANDRRTTLFENIHPIPEGVSYNSYLLLDQSTVLFDAVDWSAAPELVENVKHVLAGRELDYVVLHHLEPDHGAGLWAVLQQWPNAKLIASAMAFRFLDQFGFAPAGGERITVKEGDRISFGVHACTFYAAPQVHWPEVMVSFEETTGALFTADAFGAFGALNGKLFNDEMDVERDWLDCARRYYANIVGKYGGPVQAVLKKVDAVKDAVRLICPLHGPVWRSNFEYLLGKYDVWSRYAPEEQGVMIVYGSMYGGTERAAQVLAQMLVERGVHNVKMYDVSQTHVSYLIGETFRLSHVVLACCTYNMDFYPPMHSYLSDMKALSVQNRTFAILENGTWAPKAGELMGQFVTQQLKDCTVLEPRVSVRSALSQGQGEAMDTLADALAKSVKNG